MTGGRLYGRAVGGGGTSAPWEMEDDDTEGVGESTCPPAADRGGSSSATGGGGDSHGYTDIEKEVFDRLMEKRIPEVVADPVAFREELHRHFERLPLRSASSVDSPHLLCFALTITAIRVCMCSYAIDVNVDKAEDVLLHRSILNECTDPENRPIFHVGFLNVSSTARSRLHCALASHWKAKTRQHRLGSYLFLEETEIFVLPLYEQCIPPSVDPQYNTQSISTSENGNCGGSQDSTLRYRL